MDWDDLRVFLAVARAESLSRAGKVLRRDAATVGRRVAKLEGDLGQPLFTKSPQGYALTEAGSRLLSHAERAEQAVLSGADELTGQSGQLSGQVRIGATDGCASYILPQVCTAIQKEHPELELQIVALPRVINLSKREADMAITVSPPQAGRITVQKVTDYHLHLAAAREYLDRAPPLTSLDDLHAHPIVGYIQDMIFYPELDFLTGMGIEKVALASNLVSVQLGMVRQGGGIGVTHDFILPFAPNLRRVLTDEVSVTRSFYLIRHEGDARVERFTRVAEELTRGIRDEVARLEAMA
ncbi:transcriptional regulator, LysR family [Aliiroseovarius sediminilitoris]|uniref:Transcriptional regulator, LysR family n=1 Tax=Aliiroseovarius sediminilitoris TaxID=1173584 RepID=A0A1I0P1R1_9RHOB|nr:LysR family transcriptional regulator [Aliiroseovarius sediminilitoris]SEW07912.1 transcriptional regulator, LysR family [Aliiroseovarius sediminilitoris]